MREKRTVQSSIFDHYAEHEIGRELKAMSDWLDEHLQLLEWVESDVQQRTVEETGRKGLTYESVLRCAILKQHRQLSYDHLVFCLMDSLSCRTFARLSIEWTPCKTTLQSCISAISDVTWEQINQALLRSACSAKKERGEMLRIDSTVIESTIHAPSDSTLLNDSVRVLVRLLKRAEEMVSGVRGIDIRYRNHQRVAKKRTRAIRYTRGQKAKKSLYRDLLRVTRNSLAYAEEARITLQTSGAIGWIKRNQWLIEFAHYKPLILKVIDQAERRIFQGEKVPATDKIFSIFEEHTDIIIKGSRDIQYGHKLNLSTGRSGLVLDVVVEAGNPADTDRFSTMLDRHIEQYGKAPRQMAADGGYASRENLRDAKELEVEDMAFHKKRGLKVDEMTRSLWVYRKLRNFRAGIEAGISCLKRVYGLSRCTWKGVKHFKAYVWSSVVAHNLALLGRLMTT